MWMPKGCTRCRGDLYETVTEDGHVMTCLQCGREFLAHPRRPEMTREEMSALFRDDPEPVAA
jgi:predicted  nucleic acid-binding Zn-ribbon protein